MSLFSAQPFDTQTSPSPVIEAHKGAAARKTELMAHVGAVLQAEDELDSLIRELGQCSTKALFAGQPDTAREFTRRMYAAIKERTPEHQARFTAALEARIADGVGFFTTDAAMAFGQLGKAVA